MLNRYEAVRTNPGIHKLETGDFLFAKSAPAKACYRPSERVHVS